MIFSSKLPQVNTTIFTVMSQLANTYKAVNLSQGFPDFSGDAQLIELVDQAMESGHNQYAPMPGTIELRQAIAEKFKLLYGTAYDPETEITITAGATQALFTVISTLVKPKNEVVIFKPAYDSYEPVVQLFGGKVIPIQLHKPDFKIDWKLVEAKITSRTKLIIINSPQNPSTNVFSESDMLALQRLVIKYNLIVLSDEVYEHIVFDSKQHYSACKFPELKKRTFIVASFGKTLHYTGWKIGYCCAPKELMTEFRKIHQFNVFSVHHPSQKAIAAYIKISERYLELSDFYQKKRDLFLDAMSNTKFKFKPAQGTYFQLLDYSDISDEQDVDFAKRLVKDYGIASIPLSVFNVNGVDEKLLRFCFAKTDETLFEATKRLKKIAL